MSLNKISPLFKNIFPTNEKISFHPFIEYLYLEKNNKNEVFDQIERFNELVVFTCYFTTDEIIFDNLLKN